MNKVLITLSAIILLISACNDSGSLDKSDPLESGRGFIEASLKGNYVKAKKYLLEDSVNIQYFEGLQNFNSKMSAEDRYGYREANIIIDSSIARSDSVNIIYYTNTYKNKPSKIRMVRHDKEWLVDFKYTFADN